MFSRRFILSYFPPLFLLLVMMSSCLGGPILVPARTPPPLPPLYAPTRIRVALVLGSGGIRGMAHVGVIEELHEAGIPIDLIVGCSAGAAVGALYADNPDIEALKHAVSSMRTSSVLDISLMNCRYGLASGQSLAKVLRKHLHARYFHQLKIPLVVAVTDLYSGELLPIASGDLVPAIQASCAIPLIFTPCCLFGRVCVDGSVVNPCPTKIAKDLGAEIVIAVDLCELLSPTFPSHLFGVAARSADIASLWHNQASCQFADLTIQPKTCDVGMFNDSMKAKLYWYGRIAARQKIEEIRRLIDTLPELLEHEKRCCWIQLSPHTPHLYREAVPFSDMEKSRKEFPPI